MPLTCCALPVRVVAAVLLISSLGTSSAAAPTFSVTWEVVLEPGSRAALVSQGVVFQWSQVSVPVGRSYYYNDTLIATTANQSLWTLQSTGPEDSNIEVYAFSAIPKLIFVISHNMPQPNVSAVIPLTGTVVWSTLCPFDLLGGWVQNDLTVAPDGSTLYWYTATANSTLVLTAFDAEYGTILWSELVPYNTTRPLQCGPSHFNCLGTFAVGSPVVLFLDGRTRAVLGEVTLPGSKAQASQIIGLSQATPDVVLVLGDYQNIAINITTFTVLSSWATPDAGGTPLMLLQPMPPESPTALALLITTNSGIYAVDPFTGSSLWTTIGLTLCPCTNPGPECARSSLLTLPQAPFNGAGDVLPFELTCYYFYNPNVNAVGLLNLNTGALVRSVVTNASQHPVYEPILTPIGLGSFVAGSAFYDTDLTVFAVYPPANSSCWDVLALEAQGTNVVFSLWCSEGTGRVVAGIVSG